MSKYIWLIRHGESQGNLERRVQGWDVSPNDMEFLRRQCVRGRARSAVAAKHMSLLHDLDVSIARWVDGWPGEEAQPYVCELAAQGVALLLPADEAHPSLLPAAGRGKLNCRDCSPERSTEPSIWTNLQKKRLHFKKTPN